MFENLKAEMSRKNLTVMDFARDKELGLSYETLRNKFLGKTEWVKREMWHIKKKYFPDKSIEYLFEETEQGVYMKKSKKCDTTHKYIQVILNKFERRRG